MKKILFALLLLSGFTSCDKYANYSLCIDNQTEDTIEIVFSGNSPYAPTSSDLLTFPPKTKKAFYDALGGQMKDACSYNGIKEGEVEVHTSSGREVRKEIWKVSNWNCSGNNTEGWVQTFVITENDLE